MFSSSSHLIRRCGVESRTNAWQNATDARCYLSSRQVRPSPIFRLPRQPPASQPQLPASPGQFSSPGLTLQMNSPAPFQYLHVFDNPPANPGRSEILLTSNTADLFGIDHLDVEALSDHLDVDLNEVPISLLERFQETESSNLKKITKDILGVARSFTLGGYLMWPGSLAKDSMEAIAKYYQVCFNNVYMQ